MAHKMEEIYKEILRVVQDVTGIDVNTMLSSNKEENVDARHILVYILSLRGFSDSKISSFTKLTRPCICIIRNNFKYRAKRYFVRENYKEIYQRIFTGNEIVK